MRSSITKFTTLITLIMGVTLSPLLAASTQEGEGREETFTMVAVPTKGSEPTIIFIDRLAVHPVGPVPLTGVPVEINAFKFLFVFGTSTAFYISAIKPGD